ncbi:MAG: hypothetical protein MUF24_05215 [Chitinophagaceae bacterium]|nr:hypothetical protein [Chitinophagaceae bacterium]
MGSLAQSNFLPGSITRSNGEKQQGLIDYREWLRNPKTIVFKTAEAAEPQELKPIELRFFEVAGKERYEAAIVKKDMETLLPEFTERAEDMPAEVTDTVFLRVLYEGKLFNLYNLRDAKNRFYTKDSVNGYRELGFGQRLVNDQFGKEYKLPNTLFRNQLMQYATDFDRLPMLRNRAERTRYSENSLLTFTRLLHNDKSKEAIVTRRLFLFAGAGANLSAFTIKDHPLLDGMDLNSSVSPVFSAGLDWFGKRQRSAIFFRAEVNYFQMKTSGEKTTISITNERRDYTYRINMSNF